MKVSDMQDPALVSAQLTQEYSRQASRVAEQLRHTADRHARNPEGP